MESFIHPTAVIGPNVRIGKDCYIGPYCIIGFPPEWKGKENEGKGVIIGDRVRLTGHVTVDAGAESPTIINNDCYLMKHSHVGHDATICPGVTISCGAKVGGHSIIMHNSNIGLNAVIHQRVTVPESCMIGACAFVGKTSILKPFHKYAGVPVRELGENIK
jgi:UDP-N-acetylglucosamine acyltransferase